MLGNILNLIERKNNMIELELKDLTLVIGGSKDTDVREYAVAAAIGATGGAITGFSVGGPPGAVVGGINGAISGAASNLPLDLHDNLPIRLHENQLPSGTLFPSSFPISPSWRNDNKTQSGSDYCDGGNYC